jgi:hypothetical protein
MERLDFAVPDKFESLTLFGDKMILTAGRGSKVADQNTRADDPAGWKPTLNGLNGVSPDGRWLGVFSPFGATLFIYRLPGLEQAARLDCLSGIARFQFAPRGDELAVASRAGVEFWSAKTWQRLRVATNFTDVIYAPDSKSVWLATDFHGAGLYDAQTFEPRLPLPAGTYLIAVSADGRQLAVSVDARRLQVWDLVEVRRQLRELGMDWAD